MSDLDQQYEQILLLLGQEIIKMFYNPEIMQKEKEGEGDVLLPFIEVYSNAYHRYYSVKGKKKKDKEKGSIEQLLKQIDEQNL
ncbi:MAG: hypothetical protein QXM92_04015 [Candidatus Anstonellales archaeon]